MITRLLILVPVLFCQSFVICQLQGQQRIDSLESIFEELPNGSQKIEVLEELFYETIYSTPTQGLGYAQKGLDLSKKIKNWDGVGIAYYHIGVYHKLLFEPDSARYYYNKSMGVWKKHPNEQFKAITLGSIAALEYEKGNIDSAIVMQTAVNSILKDKKLWLKYAVGLGCLGDFYHSKGNFKTAYEYTLEGLNYLDTIPEEPWRKADFKKQIGLIELSRGNFRQSLTYFKDALTFYSDSKDSIYMGHTLVDMGNAYSGLQKLDSAVDHYTKGLEIGKRTKVLDVQANAMTHLGKTYSSMRKLDSALVYFSKAITLNTRNNTANNLAICLAEMGNTYRLLKQDDQALFFLNRGLHIADSISALDVKKEILNYRSALYRDQKSYLEALEDYQSFSELKDSLFNTIKSQQIEALKTIYETEKKEAEIALQQEEINTLNEKARADNLKKGLYASGMASTLALSGLLIFGFRQRIKKNRIAREKQEEIYKQEIEHKKKELASQTLHLVQKNTFIQELKENLVHLRNSPEKFKAEFRRIAMLLKKENASDKDWEVFKTYFAEVHNDFDQKLKTLYADISQKEIRLAAFLRMNLTTKEIAATMNVLPDSILKSKYRLKKKLGLDKETDFNQFLNSL
ncbi:MAG: tetratricopeptide repeat protein [Bacteroidota bacterium]